MSNTTVNGQEETLRQLALHWNHGMIAASIAVSLLGAFTSTQLMCQAKVSLHFSSVLVWTLLASLTFGFCSIWSLHFVAMLACELDLQIGINVPLTLLSSVLAVAFTFAALGCDLLWESYNRGSHRTDKSLRKKRANKGRRTRPKIMAQNSDSRPLLNHAEEDGEYPFQLDRADSSLLDPISRDQLELDESSGLEAGVQLEPTIPAHIALRRDSMQDVLAFPQTNASPNMVSHSIPQQLQPGFSDSTGSVASSEPSEHSRSRQSLSLIDSNSTTSYGIGGLLNMAYRTTSPAKNAFVAAGEVLYAGFTFKNIIKGLCWSLAITSMHYSGIFALRIPSGYCTFNIFLVILSGLISWVVCVVGCIFMSQMETHLAQQFLFSFVATTGVAAMHFTGMWAATFWSKSPPTELRGYPPALAIAVVSIAITTCMAANGLLAHAATVSRNKLAEIVWTRRKLWRTMAQKENAEAAAAARSEFIASASHEIRTPLHHLQGYSDLLSRTELTEEGRLLLLAIQRATKTLSLITNNVLDWSKLEQDAETVCRPVALDMRTVCESILVLLPNKDDEAEVELMVVVHPDVPKSIYLDETYIHRILMNLLSNALKFTRSGYILLLIEIENGKLVTTVKDTGSGVPPSFLPQLFEPFKQAQTRGSQRGTGLGLSIVKQLLHKMDGTIEVESKHPEIEEVQPEETGSTFTISIPLQLSNAHREPATPTSPKIAIFHPGNEKSVQGLQIAWEKFGFSVTIVRGITEFSHADWKYVWADLHFLAQNLMFCEGLLKQNKWLILVPYETQESLNQIPGLLSASHFIPLPKPLIWHSFAQRITAAIQEGSSAEIARTVRFAPKVDIVDQDDKEQSQENTAKDLVILLVEDNPINQKLGQKMLISLGYTVLLASDGQEAIDQLLAHDSSIDAILMDQSMPIKDGVTATREIRELETKGTVKRRPIIAVTAVVSTEAQALFKEAGADDFLAKPLSLGRLEKTLGEHLPGQWR